MAVEPPTRPVPPSTSTRGPEDAEAAGRMHALTISILELAVPEPEGELADQQQRIVLGRALVQEIRARLLIQSSLVNFWLNYYSDRTSLLILEIRVASFSIA